MVLNDTIGWDLENALRSQEAILNERVLPELEWDENDASLVVEDLLCGRRAGNRNYFS